MIRKNAAEVAFDVLNVTILSILALTCLFPFVHLIARSFSAEPKINAGLVTFLPLEPHLLAYKAVWTSVSLRVSFGFTVQLTVLGTLTNLAMTMLAAYPLSKKTLVFRNFFLNVIIVTMYFSGGLIPFYLLIKTLRLLDNIWALILPGAVSTYYMLVLKTFLQGIPESLEESAKLDGCNDMGVLVRIMLPLCVPTLAALALFFAVNHWNQYFNAMLLMTSQKNFTLQVRLRQLIPPDTTTLNMEGNAFTTLPNESYKAASVIVATLPIILIYPFLQKYFIKGIMLGSVKG